MKKELLFLALLFLALFCRAQSPELGRLQASLPHVKDSLRYVDALNRIAMLLYEKNIDSTFYYTRQARAIAERQDYPKGKADALNNLGVFFDIKGNLQLALKYYDEAYAGYRKVKDSANTVQSLMNIAMVYKEIGKDQRAIQRFDMALNQGKRLRQDSILSLAIYNYLLAYPARFGHDSISYYLDKAKSIATKYHDQRTQVALDQLVADDLIAHGDRKQGLDLLNKTITTALNKKLYYVSMDMLIDMGDQFAATEPNNAARYYLQGASIANKNGYLFYSQLMARKLFELYTVHGDKLLAARYSAELLRLHDQQEKLDNVSGIDYLDYALKDQQVRSLETRSKYQTALLILAIVVSLLAITVIFVIRQNLKKSKNQNNQMQTTLHALEQSQADNTRMMQIAAHDLRNPIGGIYTIATMLLDEPRSENDKMMLELIKTSGQHSLELVNDLLQVQFQTEEMPKESVDIAEMLRYCVSLLSGKAMAKGQQLNLRARPVILAASREKLWRVISNLIGNAIKFSPTGAVIEVQLERKVNSVLIAVKDKGIGIPKDIQDKIFDMFTKAKRPGTAGEQAFGLGLAISKQIVEAHSGRIWCESTPGHGTTFFVDLPL